VPSSRVSSDRSAFGQLGQFSGRFGGKDFIEKLEELLRDNQR
jgi:hypothetical protein